MNVKKKGGQLMLLAYDSNILDEEFNVDDQLGDSIDIPTVILTKDVSDILREFLLTTKENIIISVFFSGKTSSTVEMTLFYRSDDLKVFSFFNEFDIFKEKFGDKLSFEPVLKYSAMPYKPSSDKINERLNAPCIKDSKYCSSANPNLNINNGRIIVFENIRQSCIYKTFGMEVYWEYMKYFGKLCADKLNPQFNKDCSDSALEKVTDKYGDLAYTECIADMILEHSKIEEDYKKFEKKKIFRVPTLLINGVKYRGNWFGKSIFNSICDAFIDDNSICEISDPNSVIRTKRFSVGLIVVVSIVLFVLMILLLICYRRYVNKSLEITLSEKIQEQALKRINQYKAFKEEGGGSITDFFKKDKSTENTNRLELEES